MSDEEELIIRSRASLPVRGAWIEIRWSADLLQRRVSLPVRGAWIEMLRQRDGDGSDLSLPVRGAWIEMDCTGNHQRRGIVAPRAGSVD